MQLKPANVYRWIDVDKTFKKNVLFQLFMPPLYKNIYI